MSSNTSMFSMFDIANARSEFGASLSSGGSGRPPVLDSNNYWNPETQQRILTGKAVGEGGDRWNLQSNDGADLHSVNTYGTFSSRATSAEYTVNATVSSVALSNNTATIGTTTAHKFLPTDVVVISGLTNTSFNGTYIVVTTPTATSFTFTLAHSNVSQTSDSGSAVVTRVANAKEQCDSQGNVQSRFDNTGALIFDRTLTSTPTKWGDGASIAIRQNNIGQVAFAIYDQHFLFNETLTKSNLSLQTYFLDDGSYYSGRSFIVSQDRNKLTGEISQMGGQTMVGASVDINAPGFKCNNQLNLPGELFRYCFAAYDAADIDPNYPAGGVYSDRGYGKNKWLVGPRGETLWGPYLNPDRDNSDPEQHRYAKLWLNTTTNHITFEGTGQALSTSYVDIFGPTGGNAVIRLGSRNKQNAMFIGTAASSEFIGQIGLDDVSFFNLYRKPVGVNGVAVSIGVDDASSVLTIDSAPSNSGIHVLTLRGNNGQSGQLLRVNDYQNNSLFSISNIGKVKVGSVSDPVGDPNAGLTVGWNSNSVIYSIGENFPSLKAVCTTAGGAVTKIQSTPSIGLIGTESDHPFNIVTNNTARISLSAAGSVWVTTGEFGVNLSALGASSGQFEVKSKNASTPMIAGYASTGGVAAFLVDPVGNVRSNKTQAYAVSMAVPTTVGNAVDFALFSMIPSSGSGSYFVTLLVDGAGYAQTKTYLLNTTWAISTDWKVGVPISTTGPYDGNDCELDFRQTSYQLEVRLRRPSGTVAANATLTASLTGTSATFSTGTGTVTSVSAPTDKFMSGRTGGTPGNFDIGGWLKLGVSTDASIPNYGIAWSSDTPGAIKVRDGSGTLKTVTLT